MLYCLFFLMHNAQKKCKFNMQQMQQMQQIGKNGS